MTGRPKYTYRVVTNNGHGIYGRDYASFGTELVVVYKHGTKTKINGGVVIKVPDDEHGEKVPA